ncbi:MAG: senX3 [Gemmataceae bacterium]|nr:senX3 [Gemmataceae bacterium]
MRSIRRSLLGYLLLLIALAFGGVGALVDRFAVSTMRDREEAEEKRIEQAFDLRRQEAQKKFDADLLAETKALARELQPKFGLLLGLGVGRGPPGPGQNAPPPARPWETSPRTPDPSLRAPENEVQEFRLRLSLLPLGPAPIGWQTVTAATVIDPPPPRGSGRDPGIGLIRPFAAEPYRTLSPAWPAFDAPRAVGRIQEALRKLFEEDDHPGYYQFHLLVSYPGQPGRTAAVVRSARLGQDLPFDPESLKEGSDVEYQHDDVDVPNRGLFRRVVKVAGRPGLFFPVVIPPPSQVVTGRLGSRPPDLFMRVVVQHVRPCTELDDRLASDQQNRDDQLAQVREETRTDLAQLRGRLGLIGGVTFLALVLGGWVFVARGLAPLRKLSDAVSRVSERDFRLPVSGEELGRELAPIHARLNQTLDLLRRAFAREKQAVADISHELRTPIASLLATIDVSLRKPRSPDQYRATLEDCRAIARQLGNLVERIMTLASLDAGTTRTAVVRTDPAELAAECAAVIRPLAEAHGLTFALAVDSPPELDTDPDKLREVLMNLLHNAVEYNRPGGRVDLSARAAGGALVFEVRDTGIGMPPEMQGKIFERFFRADSSRHATGVHAGLGLAIVKEYVGRLNGTVTVESTPDVGSTFRVTFPVAPVSAVQPGDPSPPAGDDRPDPRHRGKPAPAGS